MDSCAVENGLTGQEPGRRNIGKLGTLENNDEQKRIDQL